MEDGSPAAASRGVPGGGLGAKPPEAEETLHTVHVRQVFSVSRVTSVTASIIQCVCVSTGPLHINVT